MVMVHNFPKHNGREHVLGKDAIRIQDAGVLNPHAGLDFTAGWDGLSVDDGSSDPGPMPAGGDIVSNIRRRYSREKAMRRWLVNGWLKPDMFFLNATIDHAHSGSPGIRRNNCDASHRGCLITLHLLRRFNVVRFSDLEYIRVIQDQIP